LRAEESDFQIKKAEPALSLSDILSVAQLDPLGDLTPGSSEKQIVPCPHQLQWSNHQDTLLAHTGLLLFLLSHGAVIAVQG
jgi:hypothetical protein